MENSQQSNARRNLLSCSVLETEKPRIGIMKGQKKVVDQSIDILQQKKIQAQHQNSHCSQRLATKISKFYEILQENKTTIEKLFSNILEFFGHSSKMILTYNQYSEQENKLLKLQICVITQELQKLRESNKKFYSEFKNLQELNQSYQTVISHQQEQIRGLKRMYHQIVIDREDAIFQNFTANNTKEKNDYSQSNSPKELKTIKQVRSKVELISKSTHINQAQTKSELQSQKDLNQRNTFNHYLKFQPQIRNKSRSQISTELFFGTEKSENESSSIISRLRQTIEELEFQLKIQSEILAVVDSLLIQNADVGKRDIELLLKTIKRPTMKKKLIEQISLAEQNAYLKECLQKLSKSEIFWSNFEDKEERAGLEQQKNWEREDTNRKNEKCLLF